MAVALFGIAAAIAALVIYVARTPPQSHAPQVRIEGRVVSCDTTDSDFLQVAASAMKRFGRPNRDGALVLDEIESAYFVQRFASGDSAGPSTDSFGVFPCGNPITVTNLAGNHNAAITMSVVKRASDGAFMVSYTAQERHDSPHDAGPMLVPPGHSLCIPYGEPRQAPKQTFLVVTVSD
jgi:hypothetical protein